MSTGDAPRDSLENPCNGSRGDAELSLEWLLEYSSSGICNVRPDRRGSLAGAEGTYGEESSEKASDAVRFVLQGAAMACSGR